MGDWLTAEGKAFPEAAHVREAQRVAALQALLGTMHGATIIEAGGHHGETAASVLSWLPGAPRLYLCIEADPRNVPVLMERAGTRVTVLGCAIGREDGEVTLRLSDTDLGPEVPDLERWTWSSSIRRPKKHLEAWPHIHFDKSVTVACRSLDSLAKEHGIERVDFLWADIEGAERDLVEGGLLTLSRTRYLYLEAFGDEMYEGQWVREEMTAFLNERGFQVVQEFDNDVLYRNTSLA